MVWGLLNRVCLLHLVCMLAVPVGTATADDDTITFTFDDRAALADARFSDGDAWRVHDGSLWQFRSSAYTPPQRSPMNIGLLPAYASGTFTVEANLMQTGRDYSHRDMCIFLGVQSRQKFIYCHLASGADATAHHIHQVDHADRSPITTSRSDGVDWGRDAWHTIRVECDADARSLRVFFDGEQALACDDLPWADGFIGFGTFDDDGRIDNIRIAGSALARKTPAFFEPLAPVDHVAGELMTFDDDGAWCWFQDERAIVSGGRLFIGSVSAGTNDPERAGDINVIVHDITSNRTDIVEMHDRLQRDDHNNPGLLALTDGRILALYTMHGNDRKTRMRQLVSADDTLQWTDEIAIEFDPQQRYGVTYSNVYRLADENGGRGRIYNLYRGKGWDPNCMISDDDGKTWVSLGQLIGGPGRPYVRYASNNTDTIHFTCTDQHPRDADNSIYHGYVRNSMICASDGAVIGELGATPATHDKLTRVFEGDANNVAWCSNIELDAQGHPHIVYSVQKNSAGKPVGQGGEDCRYRYARWDGERWHDHAVAHAGERLYPREDDYTGLICIDPHDPSTVYFSTNAHPVSGTPLISTADGERHYEIYLGNTTDGGQSWTFEPVTRNSSADNLRPLISDGPADSSRFLLWLRGRYTTMHDFDQQVVGLRIDAGSTPTSGG